MSQSQCDCSCLGKQQLLPHLLPLQCTSTTLSISQIATERGLVNLWEWISVIPDTGGGCPDRQLLQFHTWCSQEVHLSPSVIELSVESSITLINFGGELLKADNVLATFWLSCILSCSSSFQHQLWYWMGQSWFGVWRQVWSCQTKRGYCVGPWVTVWSSWVLSPWGRRACSVE